MEILFSWEQWEHGNRIRKRRKNQGGMSIVLFPQCSHDGNNNQRGFILGPGLSSDLTLAGPQHARSAPLPASACLCRLLALFAAWCAHQRANAMQWPIADLGLFET